MMAIVAVLALAVLLFGAGLGLTLAAVNAAGVVTRRVTYGQAARHITSPAGRRRAPGAGPARPRSRSTAAAD